MFNYDTGFFRSGSTTSTREPFDPEDEGVQATYVRELLAVFDAEGVDTVFVSTFARYDLPHRTDPDHDFDMASYGVVKVLEDRLRHPDSGVAWEPKAAFTALAGFYRG